MLLCDFTWFLFHDVPLLFHDDPMFLRDRNPPKATVGCFPAALCGRLWCQYPDHMRPSAGVPVPVSSTDLLSLNEDSMLANIWYGLGWHKTIKQNTILTLIMDWTIMSSGSTPEFSLCNVLWFVRVATLWFGAVGCSRCPEVHPTCRRQLGGLFSQTGVSHEVGSNPDEKMQVPTTSRAQERGTCFGAGSFAAGAHPKPAPAERGQRFRPWNRAGEEIQSGQTQWRCTCQQLPCR